MKKFLSILVCFITSFSFSQNNFLVTLGTDDQDLILSAIQVRDGYIGTGYALEDYIPLYKIDINGNFVSNKIITNKYNNRGNDIINTSDSGFVITGQLGSDVGISGQMLLAKFDATGSLQWTKQYDEGNGAEGYALLQTDDKGYIIAGEYEAPATTGYLVRTDSAGNIKWSKKFANAGYFNGLQKTKDDNYILLSGDNPDYSISLVKVDTTGNILWSKTFVGTSTDQINGQSILAVSDGSYLITGYDFSTSTYTAYGFTLKLDSLGNIQWSKLVNGGENNGVSFLDAVETPGKNFVFCGQAGDSYSSYYLVKINNTGTLLWTKAFTDEGYGFFESMQRLIPNADGGYLGAGSGHNALQDGAFMKFDSAFNICQSASSLGNLQNFTVSSKTKTISANAGNAVTYTHSFTIVSSGSVESLCGVLPVNIISFTAALKNKIVLLNWQTANEQNNAFFAIERSNNSNNNFKEVGRVNGKANSNQTQQYTFEDFNPLNGGNYYRLRQVDKDGKATYSKVVFIDLSKRIAIKLYPNPARDILMLEGLNANSMTKISIISVQGSAFAKTTTSTSTYTWNIKQLPAGTYYVKIESDKNVTTLKFVKE
ncbi:MAG TPA: T9SS type A sorting domain-containing protein [Chitinophagaceae bacterium]|jgi:hypothetical protein